jgi:hypothetical protein
VRVRIGGLMKINIAVSVSLAMAAMGRLYLSVSFYGWGRTSHVWGFEDDRHAEETCASIERVLHTFISEAPAKWHYTRESGVYGIEVIPVAARLGQTFTLDQLSELTSDPHFLAQVRRTDNYLEAVQELLRMQARDLGTV